MEHIYESWINGQKKQALSQIMEARKMYTMREIMNCLVDIATPEQRLDMVTFYEDNR